MTRVVVSRRLLLLLLAGALGALPAGAAEVRYESKRLGLRFEHPQHFVAGQPAPLPGSQKRAEAMARRGIAETPPDEEVLIERRFVKGQDLKALPRGDSPKIFLSRYEGPGADFFRQFMFKDQLRQRIGRWEVYVLPGAPGPHGEHGFYFLVPLPDRSVLEILAPRSYSYPGAKDDKPTHYDAVIRRLIESLEVSE